MIYLRTTNFQLARDFFSLLKAKINNSHGIEKVIFREEVIEYKIEEIKYSEWLVEVRGYRNIDLFVKSSLAIYSERDIKEMIQKDELLLN